MSRKCGSTASAVVARVAGPAVSAEAVVFDVLVGLGGAVPRAMARRSGCTNAPGRRATDGASACAGAPCTTDGACATDGASGAGGGALPVKRVTVAAICAS